MNKSIKIGIIGGSGLGNLSLFEKSEEKMPQTPFGEISSPLLCGKIFDKDIVILGRHGKEHTIPPSQVNYRANVWALKNEGCTHILATTACGSLTEEFSMGNFIILDQFIDFTKFRKNTFFEKFDPHSPIHTSMAEPFDKNLRKALIEAAAETNVKYHEKGTMISIEGPRFSTRAESRMFKLFGAHLINMTVATECILSNELAIPYAAIALVTDYDSWKDDGHEVTWETVLENFNKNMPVLKEILLKAISKNI
ncbi:MAG: S-methyl-5'-thioadenosine phosphorylase [Bacteroidales bacterium]|nr:S-methyl-5'-thioadenosine phosphorylase [Bacteroidales bacterium]